MTQQILKVPDVDFAGFYYPEILRELLAYLRGNREATGLTDENEYEVHVQLCRAFAYMGHLNNCRLDLTAQEMLVDSLSLLQSLKRLLKLVGVSLNSASPATAPLVARLSEVTTVDVTGFLPELSEFATESVPPITYEILDEGGVDLQRTDRATHAYGCEQVKSGTGAVSTTAPDVFEDEATPGGFASADVSRHLLVAEGAASNGGEFRVTQYIDQKHVRVVRVPGGEPPAFQDETQLAFRVMEFTPDRAAENYTPGQQWSPWSTPVAGDLMYIGHPQAMPVQVGVDVSAGSVGITGCWEYHDDELSRLAPTSATDNHDGTMDFNVSSLLGTPDRRGADVTVEHLPTGVRERAVSAWKGSANVVTTAGLLGQVAASEDPEDYAVTATWVPFENQDDGSEHLHQDGDATWELPQTQDRRWTETEVNAIAGMWLRFRVVSVSGPTPPTIEEISIDGGDQYIAFDAVQGESVGPQIVGSSDGTARQEFTLPETPFLDASETVEVDETGAGGWTTWTRVENFLNSASNSRHYMVEADASDRATMIFGDGVNGKVPPIGTDNVRASYRVGGDQDGNVGAGEVTSNADGVNGIADVANPRAAAGWRMKDGGTEADIERLKRDAPAALRTRGTASTAADVESLAVKSFVDSAGARPVARATAEEEGLGPKTVKLLVVGNGGATLTDRQRADLEAYFNGDRYASPPTKGVLVLNHQVTVFNYEPKLVTVDATVVWPGGNAEQIRNALLALLSPLALEDDGATPAWDFNGWVAQSRVYSEIHSVDPAIANVTELRINGQDASLRLGKNQLPVTAASSITINIQATEP